MGHQFMMFLVSKDPNLLKFTDSERTQDKLIFNFTDLSESNFFSDFSNELLNIAKTKNVTANFHSVSILTEDFLSEKKPYTQFFKLLATSLDRKGVSYVSNSEARNYPFFSSQYHPEVTLYTFSYNFTDHSKEARDFAYTQSLKFVNEARKNSQHFDTFTELQSLLVETTGVSKLGYKPSGEYYDNFYFFNGGEQENISE